MPDKKRICESKTSSFSGASLWKSGSIEQVHRERKLFWKDAC